MKKSYLFSFYILLCVILITGCKSKETTALGGNMTNLSRNVEKNLYNDMLQAYGSWDTFVAKGDMSMGSLSSSFELRMIHNEAIQVSIRPILGMEVARLIVTNDTVYFYEKIGRTVSQASINEISKKLPFAFTINNIQSALLGRPFLLGAMDIDTKNFKDFDYEVALPQWIMTPKETPLKVAYLFGLENEQLKQISGRQEETSRQFDCYYADYNILAGRTLPTNIQGTVKGSTKSFSAQLTYSSAIFDKETTIDISSLKNYKETSFIDLVKAFVK